MSRPPRSEPTRGFASGEASEGGLPPDVQSRAKTGRCRELTGAGRAAPSAMLRGPEGRVLEIVSRGFKAARERLSGVGELTDENVDQSLRDVRVSLLEADVDLGVVKDFLARVKQRALGEKIATRVRDVAPEDMKPPGS